ncbi:MAG: putative metallopeptidase [Syntrophomonas sp.]
MKHRVNEAYRPIAEKLVDKFDELQGVPVHNILFIENTETVKKKDGKFICAQVSAVPEKWSEIIRQTGNRQYDFVIEIFKVNTSLLTQNQVIAVIYHELRRIQDMGGNLKVVSHDIEDWSEMIEHLGQNWAMEGADIPDLTDENIDWDDIVPVTLFTEAQLRLVK